jgi:hypothetical protein
MKPDQLDIWRDEAAGIVAQMNALKSQLSALHLEHANLAQKIELESRKQAKVTYIKQGVSGKPAKKRPINTKVMMQQFTNLPAAEQAKLLEQLQASV